MGKTFLVTGANGYIGRNVVKKLLDAGNRVIASDLHYDEVDRRADFSDVTLFSGDEDIYEQFNRPDVLIHLAWRNGFVHDSDSHIEDLPKHYQFLKHMMQHGLPQMVVMGSMHEIGYWEGAITENTPANPSSMYGIAKNALRQICFTEAAKYNTIVQWTRGYYIIGDDLRSNSIFSKLTKAAEDGRKTFPFTSGKNLYDFISLDELTTDIVATASQTDVTGIINICSGKPVSLADKVEEFIKDHHFDIKLDYGAYPDRPYDSPGVWGDPTKINQIMGR